jgi:hypothetical protein
MSYNKQRVKTGNIAYLKTHAWYITLLKKAHVYHCN